MCDSPHAGLNALLSNKGPACSFAGPTGIQQPCLPAWKVYFLPRVFSSEQVLVGRKAGGLKGFGSPLPRCSLLLEAVEARDGLSLKLWPEPWLLMHVRPQPDPWQPAAAHSVHKWPHLLESPAGSFHNCVHCALDGACSWKAGDGTAQSWVWERPGPLRSALEQ